MYDTASLTWSQLQGLPVTVGKRHDYVKTIHEGEDYPVPKYEGTTIKKQALTVIVSVHLTSEKARL